MKIFAEGELRTFFEAQIKALRNKVYSETKDRLLNVNETEYIDYLVSQYQIDPLIIHADRVSVSSREVMILAQHFPSEFYVREGKSYPKQVITYHVPFSGESGLLRYAPSTRILWSMDVDVGRNSISFDIINWSDNAEQIKREAEGSLSRIRTQSENVAREAATFNQSLERTALEIVRARKTEHLKQSNVLSALGVPIEKSDQIPRTFAVPTIKKKVVVKPSAPNAAFTPEPMLDESLYEDILRICHETGVEMERHPKVYHAKDEETLRDHFIMVLAPHFQSVTGETFNKAGKTDILIRHEKSNVFVAECKFWKGLKGFHETIDQTLSYLTWRDSKAAVLCFVRNKELVAVLNQIESGTQQHPCFVKYRGRRKEGWFNFELHLPHDHSRSVRLAVLCFHFPPISHSENDATYERAAPDAEQAS